MDEPLVSNANPEQDGTSSSGDPAWDAAMAEATAAQPVADPAPEPSVEPPAATPEPPAPSDGFSSHVLDNGEHEIRLDSGEVFRGKDQNEVIAKLAKGKLEATRYISELKAPKQAPQPEVMPPAGANAIDPASLAIADLLAPAFGVKNGQELIDSYKAQQQAAQRSTQVAEEYRLQQEAQKFLSAVPEFSKSKADADKIDIFLDQMGWSNDARNYEAAYYTLKAKGEFASAAPAPTNVVRMPDGKFASTKTTPTPSMPPPPSGSAPATTGKGEPTSADLYSMSTDELYALISQQSA